MKLSKIKIEKSDTGVNYIKQIYLPEIPLSEEDTYIITNMGDRLDVLAFDYYNDVELWRVISAANNNITKGSLYPVPGTQLRIPANISSILNFIENYNN